MATPQEGTPERPGPLPVSLPAPSASRRGTQGGGVSGMNGERLVKGGSQPAVTCTLRWPQVRKPQVL